MFQVSSRSVSSNEIIATVIVNRDTERHQNIIMRGMLAYAKYCHLNYRNHDKKIGIWHITGDKTFVMSALDHLKNILQIYG